MKNQPSEMITVLLADDHPATREGIRALLEKVSDMKVVGEAQNGIEAQQLVSGLRPRILLLDLIMPGLPPYRLEKWVRENYPNTITLILTAHDRDAFIASMMEAGAAGYVDKNVQAEQLIVAIRRAACGETFFNEEQISRVKNWREHVEKKWNSLTERERQVLKLLGEGKDNKTISNILCLSIKTTEKHLIQIYSKLGVASRAEAIVWWGANGRDFPH